MPIFHVVKHGHQNKERLCRVDNATKEFKEVVALRNVSISYDAGKIHGLIGLNGSGKTVLLKTSFGFIYLGTTAEKHIFREASREGLGN